MSFIQLGNTIINLDHVTSIQDRVGLWVNPPKAPGFEWRTDCLKLFFSVRADGKSMEMTLNPDHSAAMRRYLGYKVEVLSEGGSSQAETSDDVVTTEDRRDADAAHAALADAAVNGTVPWDQVRADLGLSDAPFASPTFTGTPTAPAVKFREFT